MGPTIENFLSRTPEALYRMWAKGPLSLRAEIHVLAEEHREAVSVKDVAMRKPRGTTSCCAFAYTLKQLIRTGVCAQVAINQ
jgi:hypothetical protein